MLIDSGAADGLLRQAFEAKTHRALRYSSLKFHLLRRDPVIEVENLAIGSPRDISPIDLAHVGRGTFHIALIPLMIGRVRLTGVETSDVTLQLVRLEHGRKNYSFGGAGLSPELRAVSHMKIDRARLVYFDPERQLTLRGDFDYDSAKGARPLHLVGGGTDHGQPYVVKAEGAALTGRAPNATYAFDARLDDGAVHLNFAGATQKPFDFRGFDLRIQGEGPNLTDVGYLFGVAVPNTPPFILSTDAGHHDHVLQFSHLKGRLGGSDIEGDLTSDHRRTPRRLNANVHLKQLKVEDFVTLFSPRASHADARAQAGAPGGAQQDDQKPIDGAAFKKIDLSIDVAADRVTGLPIPMAAVHAHLELAGGRLSLAPLHADLDPGRLDIAVYAHPVGDLLHVQADAKVGGVSLERLSLSKAISGLLNGSAHATAEVRSKKDLLARNDGALTFHISQGAIERSQALILASDPFAGAWTALTDKSATVALRCAEGRFNLQNGVLAPDRLIIATDVGEAVGTGSLDLPKSRVDITLSAVPSGGVRAILNAPLHLEGDLSHPKVQVEIAKAAKRSPLKAIGAVLGAPFRSPPPTASPRDCG